MLTPNKIKLVQVAKRQLRLCDDDYRAILQNVGGVASARDLDGRGFADVMDRFRALGFTSTARRRTFGERDGMASPGQVAKIHALWQEFADDPADLALNHFLERTAKVSALRFLTANKAATVITALKAMVARKDRISAA